MKSSLLYLGAVPVLLSRLAHPQSVESPATQVHPFVDFGLNSLEYQSFPSMAIKVNDDSVRFHGGQNVLIGVGFNAAQRTECGPLAVARSEGEWAIGAFCQLLARNFSSLGPRSGLVLMAKSFWVVRDPKEPMYNTFVPESRDARLDTELDSKVVDRNSDMRENFTKNAVWGLFGMAYRHEWGTSGDFQLGLHLPPLMYLERIRAASPQFLAKNLLITGNISVGWSL